MNCPSGSLMDYVHGFLEEPEISRVREHLSGCDECRRTLARFEAEERLVREAAAGIGRLPVAPGAAALERESGRTGSRGTRARREFQTGRILTMAAALLLCSAVGWMLFQSPSGPQDPGSAQARQHIEKLGSDKLAEREDAYRNLKEMGRAAEPALRKALSSADPEVASRARRLLGRLALVEELPAGLRNAVPGIEDRLAGGPDQAWTQEFLEATELTPAGTPKHPALRKEDLSPLVLRAFRGVQNPQEQSVAADRVMKWGLRLTQYLPAQEALQYLHGTIDVENMTLQDLLGQILTRYGVSFVIDGSALREGPAGAVSMKTFDLALASNLSLLLVPRRMDFAPLDDLVVITAAGRPWKRNGRNATPPAPEDTAKVDLLLKGFLSSDVAKQSQAYDELVTLGPRALGPLLEALGPLEGKGAERVRSLCRKIAWDNNNLWLVDLPSGADLQKLSGAQKKLLETRIDGEARGTPMEDCLKLMGWKCEIKAKPEEPLYYSVKGEPLSTFLKAVTRPRGLDFYMSGGTIIIDTEDHVRAAVEH